MCPTSKRLWTLDGHLHNSTNQKRKKGNELTCKGINLHKLHHFQ